MSEVKKYKVSIDIRDIKSSESFHVEEDEEFTMNGKTYKFKDVTRIYIVDEARNGGWNGEDVNIKDAFPIKK